MTQQKGRGMETHRIDRITTSLVARGNRREALRAFATAAFGVSSLAILGREDGMAKKKRRKKKRKGGGRHGAGVGNGSGSSDGNATGGGSTNGGSGSGGGGQSNAEAVVASYCVRTGGAGSSNAITLGQPFIARQGGRLDRVDLTARGGPGGPFAVEVRDLTQGQGIATAPVLASATITVPAIEQGNGQRVTARFTTTAVLTADGQYAILVRYLGDGEDSHSFQIADTNDCPGPGALLVQASGEITFTPYTDLKLEHTVYVVP
jgi:hypothetical protein